MLGRGHVISPDWANGAKILVDGLTQAFMEEAGFPPADLRRSHVVVLPEDEKSVVDSLRSLSYRARPRVNNRTTITCQIEYPGEGFPEDVPFKEAPFEGLLMESS